MFLRRVRSRILYEQMLGRATRLCPELNKEVFKVYDAVDLYAALQDVTEMKPVATTRNVSFAQLAEELRTLQDHEAREHVLGELLAKLQRKKRRLKAEAAEQFEHLTGDTLEAFAAALRGEPARDVERRFTPELVSFLDRALGDGGRVLISDHDDRLVDVSRGYGEGRTRPEDYFEAFEEFVRTHMNDIPALAVVAQRPRELTRKQLKDLKLALDQAGFDEPSLRTAWRQKSNVDIAASILGYIRKAALGDALVPYGQRVDRALTSILASRLGRAPDQVAPPHRRADEGQHRRRPSRAQRPPLPRRGRLPEAEQDLRRTARSGAGGAEGTCVEGGRVSSVPR